MKRFSGITLVSLVITVIILLILAGIAISLITGVDGIFNKTKLAAEKYNNAAENEALALNEILKNTATEYISIVGNGEFSEVMKVNTPKLTNGLLPVAWDSSNNEYIPTIEKDWYNYIPQSGPTDNGGTSKWANAKAVNGTNTVYFVWIPRYEYKMVLGEHTSTAGEILINFIPKSKITPTTGYKIHPAFTFGEEQLSGIWVAKYESSGTTNSISAVPNATSLRNINISTMFNASLNVKTTYSLSNVDTHMMKNSEWGAVTYLTHSLYGRSGTTITINNNSDFKTGFAGNTKTEPASNSEGTKTFAYNTEKGVLASTTGNIYGVYDMSGGAWEYVMAVYNGTLGSSGFSILPDAKYYNNYSNYINTNNGEAIFETSTNSIGNTSWFNQFSTFINSTNPWMGRGGVYFDTSYAGTFFFGCWNGSPDDLGSLPDKLIGFRVTMV